MFQLTGDFKNRLDFLGLYLSETPLDQGEVVTGNVGVVDQQDKSWNIAAN